MSQWTFLYLHPFAVFLFKENCWIKGMHVLNFDRHCQIAFQEDWPICTSTNYERVPFVHILINNGECQFLNFGRTDKSTVLILICLWPVVRLIIIFSPSFYYGYNERKSWKCDFGFFLIQMTTKTVIFWAIDPYEDPHVNVTHFHVRTVNHNWTPKVKLYLVFILGFI